MQTFVYPMWPVPGKTSLIKHWIELTDWMPFKEHYQCVPPHMYDDMKAHLQEMLDIGAIRKSHNPWASMVVLVWKRDGSLRFCIVLRKHNNQTVQDAYLLPHIDDNLNSLQQSQWFSSINLTFGSLQVKMGKESKPLTSFTIWPLSFYRCDRMPFRLTNAPVTFQQLMETCLRDLNLNWCITFWMISSFSQKIWKAILRGWRPCSRNCNRLG